MKRRKQPKQEESNVLPPASCKTFCMYYPRNSVSLHSSAFSLL